MTVKGLGAAVPARCYDSSAWIGLAYLGRDTFVYAAVLAGLATTDHWLLVPLLWLAGGLAISALFIVGHDAAHGALFRARWLCQAVGQLAFLPSLHAFSVWVEGHNRVHHGHTGRADIDFVWRPLTPRGYRGLSPARRLLHRIEWGAAGAGVYYLATIWWGRMMRAPAPARRRAAFRRDRALVCGALAATSALVVWMGSARYGGLGGGMWMWGKVLLAPWLVWNHVIGVIVYLQHTGPDLRWHTHRSWTKYRGQVEGTMNLRAPALLNFFWHNIFLHVPHHVDPRIPFYHLPAASEALARAGVRAAVVRPLRLADYVASVRRCKLHDPDDGVWLGRDELRSLDRAARPG